MKIGSLEFRPLGEHSDLVARPTAEMISKHQDLEVEVVEINPELSDTAAFCDHYNVPIEMAANCIVLEASRGERKWFAVCLVPGSARADVNGVIRKHLDARRVSFAPMEVAVRETGMEYGGITPIGLPPDWPILIDKTVADSPQVIIGSGIRGSKLTLSGKALTLLSNSSVIDLAVK